MKKAAYLTTALLVVALLAQLLLPDPGQITLSLRGQRLNLSGPIFVVVLIALYGVTRLVLRVLGAGWRLRTARLAQRRDRARRSLLQGLLELSQGDWRTAEQTVTRLAESSEAPAVHFLVAARAADLQGERLRCEDWLARALAAAATRPAPVLITQAEILLRQKQPQAALKVLEQLEAHGETHTRALVLQARIHRQTGDWERLRQLEPRLRNARDVPQSVLDEVVVQIYLDRLKAAGSSGVFAQVETAWAEAPAAVSRRTDAIVAFARAAMACRESRAAARALRDLLNREWEEAAVLAFGELEPEEPLEALETAEKWLRKHPEDPALLLTCARLCMRADLYGKARSYLEASSRIRPRPETLYALATLLEQLGERERAYLAMGEAVVLAVGRRSVLPRLRALKALDRRRSPDRRHP